MILDFSEIMASNNIENIIQPREIFMSIPDKNKKYDYPRDVQTEVWNKWFLQRDNKDNIIKMNTGGGKTVVALIILKSCLNEGKGPAIYVAPDSYLVKQVMDEAKALKIDVTDNEDDLMFIKGKAILVINIHKLINGKSVFGMRQVNNVEIGSIIIDDVHACLNTTEAQFNIEINRSDGKYESIYNLFARDLSMQSENKLLDISDNVPNCNMLVPFWAWKDKIKDVYKILHEGRQDDDIVFKWPLISDCLLLCNCVISTEKIEIIPHSIPIHKISCFDNAKRRIFMSATLSDDSILVSNFDIDPENIKDIITPQKADDMGDRLILFPQAINPNIDDEELKNEIKKLSTAQNVVIIVPSFYRAHFWDDVADVKLVGEGLNEGIQDLKTKHVGLVILVNRYDGIDLPESACRVLVIDGLPDITREYDKIEQGALHGRGRILDELIQKVEQGMGRGVRSNSDYCVVLFMGKTITNVIYGEGAFEKFSVTTRKQLELSEKISEQVKGKSIDEIMGITAYCLQREKNWVTISKRVLIDVEYGKNGNIDDIILAYRKAFNYGEKRKYEEAIKELEKVVNNINNKKLKGWVKQRLAEYVNNLNPIESQNILKSALDDNIQLLKPIEGIQYKKKLKRFEGQGKQLLDYITHEKLDTNRFILRVNKIMEKLVFEPNTSNSFENSMKDIANCIGFLGKRPESEWGKGPDVLWRIGELRYFVIECKNGVENTNINKRDCNQLNGSINWFKINYGELDCNYTPIMIHLGNEFDYECSPDNNIRIITKEKLELLKNNIKKFSIAFTQNNNINSVDNVNALLEQCNLTARNFIDIYTVGFTVKN